MEKQCLKEIIDVTGEIKNLINKPNIYEIDNGYLLEKINSRNFKLLYSKFK